MVQLSRAITQNLLADTSLSAIIGDRVFPNIAPQGTVKPYVVFIQELERASCRGNDGPSTGGILFEIYSDGYEILHDIEEKLMTRLENKDLVNDNKTISVYRGVDRFDMVEEELRGHKKILEFEVFIN